MATNLASPILSLAIASTFQLSLSVVLLFSLPLVARHHRLLSANVSLVCAALCSIALYGAVGLASLNGIPEADTVAGALGLVGVVLLDIYLLRASMSGLNPRRTSTRLLYTFLVALLMLHTILHVVLLAVPKTRRTLSVPATRAVVAICFDLVVAFVFVRTEADATSRAQDDTGVGRSAKPERLTPSSAPTYHRFSNPWRPSSAHGGESRAGSSSSKSDLARNFLAYAEGRLVLLQALSVVLNICAILFPNSRVYSGLQVAPTVFGTVSSPAGHVVLSLLVVFRFGGVCLSLALPATPSSTFLSPPIGPNPSSESFVVVNHRHSSTSTGTLDARQVFPAAPRHGPRASSLATRPSHTRRDRARPRHHQSLPAFRDVASSSDNEVDPRAWRQNSIVSPYPTQSLRKKLSASSLSLLAPSSVSRRPSLSLAFGGDNGGSFSSFAAPRTPGTPATPKLEIDVEGGDPFARSPSKDAINSWRSSSARPPRRGSYGATTGGSSTEGDLPGSLKRALTAVVEEGKKGGLPSARMRSATMESVYETGPDGSEAEIEEFHEATQDLPPASTLSRTVSKATSRNSRFMEEFGTLPRHSLNSPAPHTLPPVSSPPLVAAPLGRPRASTDSSVDPFPSPSDPSYHLRLEELANFHRRPPHMRASASAPPATVNSSPVLSRRPSLLQHGRGSSASATVSPQHPSLLSNFSLRKLRLSSRPSVLAPDGSNSGSELSFACVGETSGSRSDLHHSTSPASHPTDSEGLGMTFGELSFDGDEESLAGFEMVRPPSSRGSSLNIGQQSKTSWWRGVGYPSRHDVGGNRHFSSPTPTTMRHSTSTPVLRNVDAKSLQSLGSGTGGGSTPALPGGWILPSPAKVSPLGSIKFPSPSGSLKTTHTAPRTSIATTSYQSTTVVPVTSSSASSTPPAKPIVTVDASEQQLRELTELADSFSNPSSPISDAEDETLRLPAPRASTPPPRSTSSASTSAPSSPDSDYNVTYHRSHHQSATSTSMMSFSGGGWGVGASSCGSERELLSRQGDYADDEDEIMSPSSGFASPLFGPRLGGMDPDTPASEVFGAELREGRSV